MSSSDIACLLLSPVAIGLFIFCLAQWQRINELKGDLNSSLASNIKLTEQGKEASEKNNISFDSERQKHVEETKRKDDEIKKLKHELWIGNQNYRTLERRFSSLNDDYS